MIVKSLQHTRDEAVLVEFKREADMFHRLSHDNIVKIIGLCRETEPHYLVLEYTDWVSVKLFFSYIVHSRRNCTSTSVLILFVIFVSKGLIFIL